MKKTRKKYLMIVFLTLSITLLPMGVVKAALQANLSTHVKKTDWPVNWMSNIRKMEEMNGSMGLSENLNSDLTSKESNNIDVHMMRNTEYGAIAILSASGYGNSKTLQDSSIKTTTGNKTGVYFTGNNWEHTAGGLQGYIFEGVNVKYYDTYSSAKVGDALECRGWHSAQYFAWVSDGDPYFMRDSGGLFSVSGHSGHGGYAGSDPIPSRGVAVCGAGL